MSAMRRVPRLLTALLGLGGAVACNAITGADGLTVTPEGVGGDGGGTTTSTGGSSSSSTSTSSSSSSSGSTSSSSSTSSTSSSSTSSTSSSSTSSTSSSSSSSSSSASSSSSTSSSGGGCTGPAGQPGSGPCEFPQGVPDGSFIASACSYGDTDPSVDAAVNAVMVALSGCGVYSDCPLTAFAGATADEVCQSWFAAVTAELRAQGFCAGQHIVGATDEIAVSNTGCGGKWYGYHICNYGGPKVVWNPGARRGWWAIDPAYCP